MAVTKEELINLVNVYYACDKIYRVGNSWNIRLFNWEPFSLRKTQNTIEDCFYKLHNSSKRTHNKKYLQSLFPYYVFYDTIYDLDGKMVLLLCKEKGPNTGYYSKYSLNVTKDFYNKYQMHVDSFYRKMGGGVERVNPDYTPELIIHECEDVYFVFNKQYIFDSISDRKTFKEELLSEYTKKLLLEKAVLDVKKYPYTHAEAC